MTPMPKRAALPSFIAPQLSQLVETPPEGDDWAHEIKHDGYRIHARIARGGVKLLTRTGLDWTDRYQTTAKALSKIKVQEAYLDGELCAVRADGTTSFADLQAATDSRSTQNLGYFAFDLLFLNGKDLMAVPLLERKQRLQALLKKAPRSIQYSDHHIGDGCERTSRRKRFDGTNEVRPRRPPQLRLRLNAFIPCWTIFAAGFGPLRLSGLNSLPLARL
jgi:ATP-dependent DNA ligase